MTLAQDKLSPGIGRSRQQDHDPSYPGPTYHASKSCIIKIALTDLARVVVLK